MLYHHVASGGLEPVIRGRDREHPGYLEPGGRSDRADTTQTQEGVREANAAALSK